MAVILPESKLIYVGQPQHASRSLHKWLCHECGGVQPEKMFGGPISQYEPFCVVRNPFHWVAAVWYKLHTGQWSGAWTKRGLVAKAMAKGNTFTDYLRILSAKPGFIRNPARGPFRDSIPPEDYIKFENLNTALNHFLAIRRCVVPLTAMPLYHVGQTKNKPNSWDSLYTAEGVELVTEIFNDVIEFYGYKPPEL
jgi:hypothetical protein